MSTDKYPSIFLRQMEAIVYIYSSFQNRACCEKYLNRRILKTIVSIWLENMHGYLSLDIICSSMLTVYALGKLFDSRDR